MFCHICKRNNVKELPSSFDGDHIDCQQCGEYKITRDAASILKNRPDVTDVQRSNISAYIRGNTDVKIASNHLDKLLQLKTPSLFERIDKLLLYVAKKYPRPGCDITDSILEYFAVIHAADDDEYHYIWEHLENLNYIKSGALTPTAWKYIYNIQGTNIDSNIGFVAMWFDDEVQNAFDNGIEMGIKNAGFEPKRIDLHEHNNQIVDEIIAMIKRARFVVADFTKQRGGVYFEAGYALGMGIPVIWLCRKDDFDNLHFDTKQYNFIQWEEDKLDELAHKLRYRIESTVGQGKAPQDDSLSLS